MDIKKRYLTLIAMSLSALNVIAAPIATISIDCGAANKEDIMLHVNDTKVGTCPLTYEVSPGDIEIVAEGLSSTHLHYYANEKLFLAAGASKEIYLNFTISKTFEYEYKNAKGLDDIISLLATYKQPEQQKKAVRLFAKHHQKISEVVSTRIIALNAKPQEEWRNYVVPQLLQTRDILKAMIPGYIELTETVGNTQKSQQLAELSNRLDALNFSSSVSFSESLKSINDVMEDLKIKAHFEDKS